MKTKVVLNPQYARLLLKKGYTIIDVKPKKENPNETMFVFKVEGDFEKDFSMIKK